MTYSFPPIPDPGPRIAYLRKMLASGLMSGKAREVLQQELDSRLAGLLPAEPRDP